MKKLPRLQLLNAEDFSKFSQMEKRVAIARDVIARIAAGKIKPHEEFVFSDQTRAIYDISDKSLQEFVNSNECEVCAKGGLICAWVGNFNKYNKINFDMDLSEGNDLKNYPTELIEIFTVPLLDAIELCFENTYYSWHDKSLKGFLKKGRYADNKDNVSTNYSRLSTNRLKVIMQNIIDNQGSLQVNKTLTIG